MRRPGSGGRIPQFGRKYGIRVIVERYAARSPRHQDRPVWKHSRIRLGAAHLPSIPVYLQVGTGSFRLMISAVAVGPTPPPTIMIWPLLYMTEGP